jgi:phage pi2 protein 07
MKKWIKVILGLIFLGALAFATYIAILILSPSTDVIENSVEYHTKEELSELYWQNEDLLNRVKDSVLSNKKVLQALIDEQDGDTGIYL